MFNTQNKSLSRDEYQRTGIITVPVLSIEKTKEYRDFLINRVSQDEWVLSLDQKNIKWGIKNVQLISGEWNKINENKYFYLPDTEENSKSYNFPKSVTMLNFVKNLIPNIETIVDPLITLMTSGCYIGIHDINHECNIRKKARFIFHLTDDWNCSDGGILTFPDLNLEVEPKFGHITIFNLEHKHLITPIKESVNMPHLSITGFLN